MSYAYILNTFFTASDDTHTHTWNKLRHTHILTHKHTSVGMCVCAVSAANADYSAALTLLRLRAANKIDILKIIYFEK